MRAGSPVSTKQTIELFLVLATPARTINKTRLKLSKTLLPEAVAFVLSNVKSWYDLTKKLH